MPTTFTRKADANARITLPKKFANARVIIQITEPKQMTQTTQKVAKKARFAEETITRLSDADRDRFLQLLESPPKPNAALKQAMAKYRASHG